MAVNRAIKKVIFLQDSAHMLKKTMHLKLSYGRKVLMAQVPDTGKASVRQVMHSVKDSHPEIYQHWCDADGNLRETLTMFVNGDHIRYRNGLETVVEDGDEIYIVPLITGG
jgi:molybdopterin converting factor small subunit